MWEVKVRLWVMVWDYWVGKWNMENMVGVLVDVCFVLNVGFDGESGVGVNWRVNIERELGFMKWFVVIGIFWILFIYYFLCLLLVWLFSYDVYWRFLE